MTVDRGRVTTQPPADLHRSTVVAWYGDKPSDLAELVRRLQQETGRCCGFVPRPVPDVHATILGLETAVAPRDLDGLLHHLVDAFDGDPLDIRFGGFGATDRRLTSRGRTLDERTLGVWGEKLVLIGWPVTPAPSPRLAEIRRGCEEFGFRHKYDRDPDAYLVLGELDDPAGVDTAGLVERLRGAVLTTPVRVRLDVDALALVEYVDPRLPAATSRRWPIATLTRW
jgi:hypothetical protein